MISTDIRASPRPADAHPNAQELKQAIISFNSSTILFRIIDSIYQCTAGPKTARHTKPQADTQTHHKPCPRTSDFVVLPPSVSSLCLPLLPPLKLLHNLANTPRIDLLHHPLGPGEERPLPSLVNHYLLTALDCAHGVDPPRCGASAGPDRGIERLLWRG